MPESPPPLLPGPSADSLFWRYARRAGLMLLAHLVLVEVLVERLPDLAAAALMLLPGLGLLWYFFVHGMRRTGERNLEELARGYTTFTMVFGDFWPGGRRFRRRRMPWDYSGVWVLHRSTGQVLSPPQRWLEPPGVYPSPRGRGAWEVWTGSAWSGHLRPPPAPRPSWPAQG